MTKNLGHCGYRSSSPKVGLNVFIKSLLTVTLQIELSSLKLSAILTR